MSTESTNMYIIILMTPHAPLIISNDILSSNNTEN